MDVISNIFQVSPFVWQARVETEHSSSALDLSESTDSTLYFCVVLGGSVKIGAYCGNKSINSLDLSFYKAFGTNELLTIQFPV